MMLSQASLLSRKPDRLPPHFRAELEATVNSLKRDLVSCIGEKAEAFVPHVVQAMRAYVFAYPGDTPTAIRDRLLKIVSATKKLKELLSLDELQGVHLWFEEYQASSRVINRTYAALTELSVHIESLIAENVAKIRPSGGSRGRPEIDALMRSLSRGLLDVGIKPTGYPSGQFVKVAAIALEAVGHTYSEDHISRLAKEALRHHRRGNNKSKKV
jgi:hypothetical protein